jgi:hypothetical protein
MSENLQKSVDQQDCISPDSFHQKFRKRNLAQFSASLPRKTSEPRCVFLSGISGAKPINAKTPSLSAAGRDQSTASELKNGH